MGTQTKAAHVATTAAGGATAELASSGVITATQLEKLEYLEQTLIDALPNGISIKELCVIIGATVEVIGTKPSLRQIGYQCEALLTDVIADVKDNAELETGAVVTTIQAVSTLVGIAKGIVTFFSDLKG